MKREVAGGFIGLVIVASAALAQSGTSISRGAKFYTLPDNRVVFVQPGCPLSICPPEVVNGWGNVPLPPPAPPEVVAAMTPPAAPVVTPKPVKKPGVIKTIINKIHGK